LPLDTETRNERTLIARLLAVKKFSADIPCQHCAVLLLPLRLPEHFKVKLKFQLDFTAGILSLARQASTPGSIPGSGHHIFRCSGPTADALYFETSATIVATADGLVLSMSSYRAADPALDHRLGGFSRAWPTPSALKTAVAIVVL